MAKLCVPKALFITAVTYHLADKCMYYKYPIVDYHVMCCWRVISC